MRRKSPFLDKLASDVKAELNGLTQTQWAAEVAAINLSPEEDAFAGLLLSYESSETAVLASPSVYNPSVSAWTVPPVTLTANQDTSSAVAYSKSTEELCRFGSDFDPQDDGTGTLAA